MFFEKRFPEGIYTHNYLGYTLPSNVDIEKYTYSKCHVNTYWNQFLQETQTCTDEKSNELEFLLLSKFYENIKPCHMIIERI